MDAVLVAHPQDRATLAAYGGSPEASSDDSAGPAEMAALMD